MTIPTVPEFIPRIQYTASGGQTVFNVPFPFYESSDLTVYLTPAGQPAIDSVDILSLNVNYTVTGENTLSGGSITLIVPATTNDIITIQRTMSLERTSAYSDGVAITADMLNQDLNRQIMMLQDEMAFIKRIIPQYPTSEVIDTAALGLPLLGQNQYWKGGPSDSIITTTIEENTDCSTLRSDLAQNGSVPTAGANLVGYFSATSGATNVQDELDLINSGGGAGGAGLNTSILDFGGNNTGTADNTAAFNAALTYYAANTTNAILYFPAGTYLFNSRPNSIGINLSIVGQGSRITNLIRNYNEANPILGLLSTSVSASIQLIVKGIHITAAAGTTSGSAILYHSDATHSAQSPVVEDVLIAGGGGGTNFAYGLLIDGSANDSGINYPRVTGLSVTAACTTATVELLNVKSSISMDFYTDGTVTIDGPSATRRCADLNINHAGGSAQFNFNYCSGIAVTTSKINIVTNTSNSLETTIYGSVNTKAYNSTTFKYISQNDFLQSINANGYQTLPGGLIIQWLSDKLVSSRNPSSPTTFTLPINFSTANFGVFGLTFTDDGGTSFNIPVAEMTAFRTLSSVSLVYNSKGNGDPKVNFMVIGY